MLVPQSITGFTKASDSLCCSEPGQPSTSFKSITWQKDAVWNPNSILELIFRLSLEPCLPVLCITTGSPAQLGIFFLSLPRSFKGPRLSEHLKCITLHPAILGYYCGFLIRRYCSLVSLKWFTAAAGIFCFACDIFGSKWNNRLKTSLVRTVDTLAVSLRFKYSTAGCNNKIHPTKPKCFHIWVDPQARRKKMGLTQAGLIPKQSYWRCIYKSTTKLSPERVNPYYKTSLAQSCKFKMHFTEIDWQVLSPKRAVSCLYPTELQGPF